MQVAQVKLNATVRCPEDRGDKPYQGRVMHVDSTVNTNHQGIPYVWVTVQHPGRSQHVWPSNRLS